MNSLVEKDSTWTTYIIITFYQLRRRSGTNEYVRKVDLSTLDVYKHNWRLQPTKDAEFVEYQYIVKKGMLDYAFNI